MAYIGKSPSGTGVRQRYYFTATGGETSLSGADDNGLTLSYSDGAYVDVLLNGIELVAGTDYNTTTANTIAGLSALAASDIVTVTVYDIFTVADTVSAKDGGTFSSNVTFNGNINAGTIKDATGTNTGLTINSSGRVAHPKRPILSARGVATSATLSAADSTFNSVTSWTTTDVNVGGLLNAGGYAEVPTGFAGIYQITWISNAVTTTDYNSAMIYHYDGSTYTQLVLHYSSNDYNGYSTGTTLFYDLDEGDKIYVGYDNQYGTPSTANNKHNFSMMYIG
jgi:hypothetical protein